MGFYFQNDYWEGAKYLPENQRKSFIFAVVNYYFTGEEIDLKREAKGQFIQVKRRIDMARQEANKKKNQRDKARDKSGDSPQDKSGTLLNKEGEIEGEIEVSTDVDTNPPISPQGFPWACLDALNVELGVTYASMPDKCTRTLARFEGKYDLEAVRAMIRYKREEWQGTKYSKCLTPNTLFSPDHFEQYIHQSQAHHQEVSEYAVYDR